MVGLRGVLVPSLRGVLGGVFPRVRSGPSGPINTVAPAITGDAIVGETLTVTPGEWTGTGTVNLTYQWRRDGDDIVGATATTYELTEDDLEAMVDVRETGTDDVGSASVLAEAVGPVEEAATVYADWHVDEVNGDDANGGTSDIDAFATFAKLDTVYQAGDSVAIAKGGHFRESVGGFGGDALPNGGTIVIYGDGRRPIIDGCDIADNADFVVDGTHANVFNIDWTVEQDGSESYFNLKVNGVLLRRVADKAACQAAAGTFTAPALDGVTGTYAVSVHPPGSTNPTTDGKVYEITSRVAVVILSNGWTVSGLHTQMQGTKNGSLWVGTGSAISDCLCEDGVVHNFFIASGTATRVDCYGIDTGAVIGGQTMAVANTDGGDTATVSFIDCRFHSKWDPATTTGLNVSAIHTHTSGDPGDNYLTVTADGCTTWYCTGSFTTSDAITMNVLDHAIYNCTGGISGDSDAAHTLNITDTRAYGHLTGYKLQRCLQGTPGSVVIRNSLFVTQDVSGGALLISGGVELDIENTYLGMHNYVSGNRNGIDDAAAMTLVNSQKNIFKNWLLGYTISLSTITVSDNNSFHPATMDMWVNGTYSNDIAAYKTAQSQDANSITDDPLVTDGGGTQEPIFTIGASQAATNGWGPTFAAFDRDLDKATAEAEWAAA